MLDQPLSLPNGARLPNRLAKAAMSEGLADRHGRATPGLVRLYERFGRSGAGLLLSGNVMVDGRYLEHPGNVVLDDSTDDAALAAQARVAAAARAHGAAYLVQISHPGRQVQRFVARTPVAPSAVAPVRLLGAFGRPRALEPDEIPALVDAFARTAERCERAGASGVQIHGAHGYLVNQFLSPLTNRRTDAWGGPLAARARFLVELVRAVRARTAPGFILSVKLNSADFQRGGFDEDDALEVVRLLEAERVDLLEISGGTYESARMMDARGVAPEPAPTKASTRAREAYFLEFARRVRAVSRIPLMVTGGFRTRAAMEEALADGALDVVGLARPLAVEPDLPARLLSGAAERSTVRPRRTLSRRLDLIAEGGWHALQLRRIAEGREPDPTMSPTWAALRFSVGQMVRGLRLPRRLGLAAARPLPALPSSAQS